MKAQKGLTLIELMVTIAIAMILLAVGVPAYDSMMSNNRSVASTNRLVGALKVARSEAINRGTSVSLCPRSSVGSFTCGSASDWANGLLLFTDGRGVGGAGTYSSSSEDLLNEWGELESSPTITSTVAYVRYSPTGERDTINSSSAITIQLQFADCKGKQVRTLTIDNTGYVSVGRASC